MVPHPPPGQGPIDPRGAFQSAPGGIAGGPPGGFPPGPPRPQGFGPPSQIPPVLPGMMPMGMMPPMFPPPPPPRGGSFARGIFLTLATTIFGFSLLLNLYLLAFSGLAGSASSSADAIKEKVLVEGDATQKIVVVPVEGVIDARMAERFRKYLDAAEHDAGVRAVVVAVDSPGGGVTASDEMYQRLVRLKAARPGVPVVVTQGALAASGGYYVSCGGDYVFAQPTTLTGNIGVLLPRFNVSRLLDKWGVEETTIVSSGATYKNAGSMFKPEDLRATAYLQDIADQAFGKFKGVVAAGRKLKPADVDALADGKIYTADDALKLKLVDQIGYPADAYAYARTAAGIGASVKPLVVRYQPDLGLLGNLLGGDGATGRAPAGITGSSSSSSSSSSVTFNGVSVSAENLSELMTPRLMYLWRGE